MYFKNQLKLIEHEYNSKSINSLNNIKLIKSYATESFESERVFKILENYMVINFSFRI
jgi:ABC-type multidrug transport system fused ATPase/permease subunit